MRLRCPPEGTEANVCFRGSSTASGTSGSRAGLAFVRLWVSGIGCVRRSLLGCFPVSLGLRLLGSIDCLASFALPALEVIVRFAWRVRYSGKWGLVRTRSQAPEAPRCLPSPIHHRPLGGEKNLSRHPAAAMWRCRDRECRGRRGRTGPHPRRFIPSSAAIRSVADDEHDRAFTAWAIGDRDVLGSDMSGVAGPRHRFGTLRSATGRTAAAERVADAAALNDDRSVHFP